MKVRIFLVFSSLFFTISISNAAVITSSHNTYHPYYSIVTQFSISSLSNSAYNLSDGFGKTNNEFGYGAGIGAGIRGNIKEFNIDKFKINGLYLGVEAFINADKTLSKKTSHLYRGNANEIESERVNIYSVFNARVNIGYSFKNTQVLNKSNINGFFNNLIIFTSLGLKHFEYESTYTYTDYNMYYIDEFIRYNDWKIAPALGFGLIYSISKRFEAVLGYEYSFFNIKDQVFDDPNGEGKVKLRVNTIRLGLNYVF